MTQSKGCLAGLFGITSKQQEDLRVDHKPFRVRDDFLSSAELSFYHVLKLALDGEGVICPKTSLAELFFVAERDDVQRHFNRISSKRIDFLVCDPQTMRPLYGIELDDKSHQNPKRIQRDAFVDDLFIQSGLTLIRFPAKMNYVLADVKKYLQAARHDFDANQAKKSVQILPGAVPICAKCGVPMVRRIARNGDHPGSEFFGCTNYPRCREVLPIPQDEPA